MGGTTPYSYTWSNSDTIEDIVNLGGGSYSVTVTDGQACIITLDTVINQPPELLVAMVSTDVTCFSINDGSGTAFVSGGTPPYVYLWNDLVVQTTSIATGLTAGSYVVLVTDSIGCTASGILIITEPDELIVTVSDSANCLGDSSATLTALVMGGTSSYTYSWDDNLSQVSVTAIGLSSGTYNVQVEDANGCTASGSAIVIALALPIISAIPDGETIVLGGSITLSASGGLFYNWSPSLGLSCTGCQNTVASPVTTTEYTVIGTDANNCSGTATLSVIVQENLTLFVADIFSPNGDGENDRLFVQGLGIKMVQKFIIYNRWGEMVFENTDFEVTSDSESNKLQGWDGRYKGTLVNPSVFVYYVKCVFLDDSTFEDQGDITLVY